jgi:transposase
MIRKGKDKVYFRLGLVMHAKEHGIKPAARSFCTTPKTVRKWIKRYKEEGN